MKSVLNSVIDCLELKRKSHQNSRAATEIALAAWGQKYLLETGALLSIFHTDNVISSGLTVVRLSGVHLQSDFHFSQARW